MRLGYLLIACFFLFGCNSKPFNPPSNDANNQPDTSKPVITASFQTATYPAIFQSAFDSYTKVTDGALNYRFYSFHIGNIRIESGKLIACDPVVMHDASPFVNNFPIGVFRVDLAIARTENDKRVAFSRIVFSDSAITKWAFALKEGQQPIPLRDSSIYCYGVDAGTGLFIDSVSNKIFNAKDFSEWKNVFVSLSGKNNKKGYIFEFEGHNLATFETGYGDGCYATYIGYDKQGGICQLLTDFQLVPWWRLDEEK